MTSRLARFALAAVIGGTLWSLRRQFVRRLDADAPKPKHPAVQTWEGEGGALPATGAQMGPDPVFPEATTEAH